MTLSILTYEALEENFIRIDGQGKQFAISRNAADYVEETKIMLQNSTQKLLGFPFTIHFEGYDDEAAHVLDIASSLDITMKWSGRTVLTTSAGKTFHRNIPAYSVTVYNQQQLEKVFNEWFYLASHNQIWCVTKGRNFVCEANGFPKVSLEDEPLFFVADHDAYGFLLYTSCTDLQDESVIHTLFATI